MKRHKRIDLKNIPGGLYRYVIVMRHRPFRNKINRIMYWANQYKWDRAYYKKYDNE